MPPIVLSLSEYVKRNVFQVVSPLHCRSIGSSRCSTRWTSSASTPIDRSLAEAGREDLFPANPDRPFRAHARAGFPAARVLRETLEALASIDPAQRPALRRRRQGRHRPYQRMSRMMRLSADVDLSRAERRCAGPLLRMADFFVLPTRHDPCSLVVLESLAMGVPVISTRFNGASEIMTDGVHGYVLPEPRDVRAIAGAITKMMDAPRRGAECRAPAWSFARGCRSNTSPRSAGADLPRRGQVAASACGLKASHKGFVSCA
jgi:hypothetical protein